MDSNHRCLDVSQASSPLDHGTKCPRVDLNHRPPPCQGGEHSAAPRGPSPAGRSRTYLNPRIRRVPGRSATAGKRPVRGLNPSHPVDSRAGTPASSQGGKDGRIRTLSARVGAALLSQEHILILVVWRASRRKPDVDNVQHGGLTLRRSPSTPTRTRTRNPSFEARNDFRFTIGVCRSSRGRT